MKIFLRAFIAAAFIAIVGWPVTAHAHAQLISSSPEDGAVLAESPSSIRMEFSEILDENSTVLAVVIPSGDTLILDAPTFDDNVVEQPLRLPIVGEYTLSYRIVSVDGHPVEGTVAFTVESVLEENADAPTQAAPNTPSEVDPEDSTGTPAWVWWTVAGAGFAIIVAVGILVTPQKKSPRKRTGE